MYNVFTRKKENKSKNKLQENADYETVCKMSSDTNKIEITNLERKQKPENAFLNLLFNIAIPILILNKLSVQLGPLLALFLALAFPFGYGVWDYLKKRKMNFISILGLINVAFTGGLAVVGLTGFWFAVKEAAFPALVGIFVFASAYTNKPFIKALFLNPQLVNTEKLLQRLQEQQKESQFNALLKHTTQLLSLSFFMSALLNFLLARRIFLPMTDGMDSLAQATLLNDQIAEMTKWGMIVILLPSMLFLLGIFWYLIKGIEKLSGLTSTEWLAS